MTTAVPTPADTGVAGAAAYLGVTHNTIRNWIASGLLPARRVGPRLIRIRFADLDALGDPLGPGTR